MVLCVGGLLLLATGYPAGIGWGVLVFGLALVPTPGRAWGREPRDHASEPERDQTKGFPAPHGDAVSPAATAHELQRAAGALQAQALSTVAVDALPVTIAHLQEALDRLSVSMELRAHAVAAWCGKPENVVADESLPSEARALRWHLRNTARALRASRDACSANREWSQRLLDERVGAGDPQGPLRSATARAA